MPLFIYRDFTPDNELRYLSIIDESLSNHTFFAFTNHAIPYADKPPLYLWGMMGLRTLAGGHFLWLYAILNIVPAIVITRIFNKWTSNIIPTHARLVAQGMLLVCALFLASTLVVRMDMLMCMFIVLSFYEYWRIKVNPKNPTALWLYPVFIFLAVFSKGPFGLLIPLVSTFIYSIITKNFKTFLRAWGWRCWIVLLPLFCCWFCLVFREGGSEYLNNLLFHQTMDRAINSFHHSKPFYYYLVTISYSLLPWTIIILGLIISGFIKRRNLSELQVYFVTIALSTLLLLSCVSSKIQIYLLPAIPFIVYTAAISLPRYQKDSWVITGMSLMALIFILVFPAFIISRSRVPSILFESVWIWIIAAVFSVTGIIALTVLYIRKLHSPINKSIWVMIYGIFINLFLSGFGIRQFNEYIGYGILSDKLKEISSATGITTIKFKNVRRSENIDVYLPKNIKLINDFPDDESFQNCDIGSYIFVTENRNNVDKNDKNFQIVGKFVISIID